MLKPKLKGENYGPLSQLLKTVKWLRKAYDEPCCVLGNFNEIRKCTFEIRACIMCTILKKGIHSHMLKVLTHMLKYTTPVLKVLGGAKIIPVNSVMLMLDAKLCLLVTMRSRVGKG